MSDELHKRRKHWAGVVAERMGRERMAAALGYNDTNYLNQVVTGHSKLGNKNATRWADALNLGFGYFDQPIQAADTSDAFADLPEDGLEAEFMAMAEALDRSELMQFLAEASAILTGVDQVELAETILRNARESLS